MVVSRLDYAYNSIKLMRALQKKFAKLSEKSQLPLTEMTPKRRDKLNADMNWNRMYYEQEKERLGYALGFLTLSQIQDYYEPSGFHKYKGVREELEKITFKN